ncbi:MAG: ATP-binding protein [Ruminococcus sp.]|nr:ATP-binding protein [Ruminococcus sp.]
MRITNLEIHNFRGINSCNIDFPFESRVICLIGTGDSTKSTILKAIEWILWPTWNLVTCDNDFYNGNTKEPIIIRGTFTEISESLLTEDKFGLYLRRSGVELKPDTDDEPIDNFPICLTIELIIDASLEPKWTVVCNRKEPKPISNVDRRVIKTGFVGGNCSKDMVWGKNSVLQKYANSKDTLHEAYTTALREAINNTNLHSLDEVSSTIVEVGKQYGVGFNSDLKSKIMMQNGSFSSTVGIFEGSIPLSQRGTGSQKLLSIGLNIQSFSGSTLLLIDEIETGLEPYRLKSLIAELRATHKDVGQVIFTTHSPVAVTECSIQELIVIDYKAGVTAAHTLFSDDTENNSNFQAELRRNAEAFLSRKIIVCEGSTEIGFVRAFDKFLHKTQKCRMAHKGITTADGHGETTFKCAERLQKCGYKVCIIMDSDKDSENETKKHFRDLGIPVFDWDIPNAFEEQIFFDVPTEVAIKLLNLAKEKANGTSICDKLKNEGIICFVNDNDDISISELKAEEQIKIGKVAKHKKSEWYKRIDLGEKLGDIVFEYWDTIDTNSKLKKTVNELSTWVMKND